MSVNETSVDEMSVDETLVDEMTFRPNVGSPPKHRSSSREGVFPFLGLDQTYL
jgi:hypothetical protein